MQAAERQWAFRSTGSTVLVICPLIHWRKALDSAVWGLASNRAGRIITTAGALCLEGPRIAVHVHERVLERVERIRTQSALEVELFDPREQPRGRRAGRWRRY